MSQTNLCNHTEDNSFIPINPESDSYVESEIDVVSIETDDIFIPTGYLYPMKSMSVPLPKNIDDLHFEKIFEYIPKSYYPPILDSRDIYLPFSKITMHKRVKIDDSFLHMIKK